MLTHYISRNQVFAHWFLTLGHKPRNAVWELPQCRSIHCDLAHLFLSADDWLKDVDGGARQLFFFGYIWLYYVLPIFSPSIVAYIYHKTVSTLVTNGLVTRENLPRNRGEFIGGYRWWNQFFSTPWIWCSEGLPYIKWVVCSMWGYKWCQVW